MTKKTDLTAEQKILRARININNGKEGTPFFSYLLSRLPDVEASWLPMPTLATDGDKIYWHRDFIDTLTVAETAFCFAHEIMHLVLQHFGRRGQRDRDKWGQAIDHELNLTLLDHKIHARCLEAPSMILADKQYQGLTAEQIYPKLPEGSKDKSLDFHFDLSDIEKAALEGEGKNKGMKIPALADPNAPAMIARWQQRLQEAVERASRERGHLPGNVAEIVQALKKPVIPWQRYLQDWISTVLSRDDYNWNFFNPMYVAEYDMYLPACRNETIGTVGMIIDCSGSVNSQEQLPQFLSETLNIRQNYGISNLIVIQCDAEVQNVAEYSEHDYIDPNKVKIHGRGGTDFRPAFQYFEDNNIQPEFVTIFTDAYGAWPEKRPAYPVLAALTKEHADTPDWMDKFVLHV